MRCTNCKKEYADGLSFCPNCGQKTPSNTYNPSVSSVFCPHCGQSVSSGTKFCTSCGKRIAKLSSGFESKHYSAAKSGMIIHILLAFLAFWGAFYIYSMGEELPFYLKDERQSINIVVILVALLGLEECYEAYLTQQVYLTLREQQLEFSYMVSFPFPHTKYESLAYDEIQSIKIAGSSTLIIRSCGAKYRIPVSNAEEAKMLIEKQRS